MTSQTIDRLKAYGCDTAEALERFMFSEDMYLRYLEKFLEDESFAQVRPAIEAGDREKSLRTVHNLKGMAGNLGFTPLYKTATEMVELYREGQPEKADAMYEELAAQYRDIRDIIMNY